MQGRYFGIAILSIAGIALFAFGGRAEVLPGNNVQEMAPLFGKSHIPFFCGNGMLAAGVDARGGMAVCRWPGPGGPNQLDYVVRPLSPELSDSDVSGALWGIRFGDQFLWVGQGKEWDVTRQDTDDVSGAIITVLHHINTGMEVEQRVFVLPNRPLLVSQIAIRGIQKECSCIWYANFSPTMRRVSGMPVTELMFPAQRDFALFTDDGGKTFHQLRPPQPGTVTWDAARRIVDGLIPPTKKKLGWEQFIDCVWIAFAGVNDSGEIPKAYQCGNPGTKQSAFEQAQNDTWAGKSAALGQCDVAYKCNPMKQEIGYAATVLIAFGKSREEVDKVLEDARGHWTGLYEEARQHGGGQRQSLRLPNPNPRIYSYCERLAQRLLMCRDKVSGAFVVSPVSSSLSTLVYPQDSAWIALALDMMGQHEYAGALTHFVCNAIRSKDEPDLPSGSLAAALYTDGKEASPHLVLEADASAWAAGAVWRHACFLENDVRRSYLEKNWEAVSRAGDFLAEWVDARNREPFPSFDRTVLCDRQSRKNLLMSYMGMDSVIRIAAALDQKVPEIWSQRKHDLDLLIRLQCVNGEGEWNDGPILPYWHVEFARNELPDWKKVIERQRAVAGSDILSIEPFCDAALVWQGTRALDTLKPAMEKILAHEVGAPFDALRAARSLIAAETIYPPAR